MSYIGKVLLVWPKTAKGFYDFHPLNTIFGGKGQFIPLPLLSVASELGNEWDYIIIDEEIEPFKDSDLNNVDYVLISINILQLSSALNIIKSAEKRKIPVVVGGPLVTTIPSMLPDGVTKVVGEIESPCNDTSNTGVEKSVGFMLNQDMKNKHLKARYEAKGHPVLNKINAPRYDLANVSRYFNLSMQTSRGCQHCCSFCQIPCLYGRHQRKTPEQIENELTLLYKYGGGDRTVFIIDDNFMGNIGIPATKSELIEVLATIYKWQIQHDFPYDFCVQCSLEIAEHEDVLEKMAKTGINMMFLGIETLNSDILQSMQKRQNLLHSDLGCVQNNFLEVQVKKIDKLRSYGMGVFAGLMLGFDGEDRQCIDNLILFLRMSCIPVVGITILQAPPGTPLFNRLSKCNRISINQDRLVKSFQTNIVFKTNPQDFYNEFLRCIKAIYSPVEYFARTLEWVTKWNSSYLIPGRKGSLPSNLRAKRLLRSFFNQGIIAPYRIHYWLFLFKTFFRFFNDQNRLGICLYLGFFYEVLQDNVAATEDFVNNLPSEIIKEWEKKTKGLS